MLSVANDSVPQAAEAVSWLRIAYFLVQAAAFASAGAAGAGAGAGAAAAAAEEEAHAEAHACRRGEVHAKRETAVATGSH